jgi:hypothetical protein
VERPIHHVVAFGAVLSADILNDPDVAAFDNHVGGVVVSIEDGAEMGTGDMTREQVGAVGCAREQDRGVFCALGHQDHSVKTDPIAHGNHGFAARVVEAVRNRPQAGRRLAWVVGVLRLGRLGGAGLSGGRECKYREGNNGQNNAKRNAQHQLDLSQKNCRSKKLRVKTARVSKAVELQVQSKARACKGTRI